MEPWALRTRKVRELEQELSVVLDDADCRAAGFTRREQRRFSPERGGGAVGATSDERRLAHTQISPSTSGASVRLGWVAGMNPA